MVTASFLHLSARSLYKKVGPRLRDFNQRNLGHTPVFPSVVVALLRKLGALLCQQEASRDGVVALQVVGAEHVWLKVLVRRTVMEPFVDNFMRQVRLAAIF